MKKLNLLFIIILSIPLNEANAQHGDTGLSFSVNYNLTTDAKLFLQPKASDPVLAYLHSPLEDIWGFSVNIRYSVFDEIFLGINAGFIKETFSTADFGIAGPTILEIVSAEEGFELIPVEFDVFYLFPFSNDDFKFYIGAGAGAYFGNHIRNFSDVSSETIEQPFSVGVHVLTGIEYMIFDYLSARFEMKFRDPEIEMKNRYTKLEFEYEGRNYRINNEIFHSKVNLDGTLFQLGIAFHI